MLTEWAGKSKKKRKDKKSISKGEGKAYHVKHFIAKVSKNCQGCYL